MLATTFNEKWRDLALASRDAQAKSTEADVAAVVSFDLTGLSQASSSIESVMTWDDDVHHREESHGEEYDGHDVTNNTGEDDETFG